MTDTPVTPAVNVVSDTQIDRLIAAFTPGPSIVARAGSQVKVVGSDIVAGAEKVGSEVKTYLPLIAFVTAVASIAMQLVPVLAAHIK